MRVPININNALARVRDPLSIGGLKFPTTKEIQEAVAAIADKFNQENDLVDRFFPEDSTFASELELYLLRTQDAEQTGMTFVHQVGSTSLPVEARVAKVDLAKATWSPLAFKESRVWDEKEILYLGRLADEVQAGVINEQIAESLTWLMARMRNRRRWLTWQVMRTGRITIQPNDPYNPNGLKYVIDYGVTDIELPLPQKFDAKDGNGNSAVDPIQYFRDLIKAATYFPDRRPVAIIVGPGFDEVLADNTFVQKYVEYEKGWVVGQNTVQPPREVYRQAALDIFKRYTGLEVMVYDKTYRDQDGSVKYWIPVGELIVLNQSTGPVGRFVYTAHVAGQRNGKVVYATGPYLTVKDHLQDDPPYYAIIAGFHGLPQLSGYNTEDFSFHRFKWLKYADTVQSYLPPFPPKVEL
ncbi:major head protein [Thermus phage G20c]|nr:major head protein [Thermus phage G20c]